MARITKEVLIGGKKRPVHFGYNALAAFGDKYGVALAAFGELVNNMTFSQLISLIEIGLQEGARITKTDLEIGEYTVGDWIDERSEAQNEIIKIFASSMARLNPEDEKKSEPETTSTEN